MFEHAREAAVVAAQCDRRGVDEADGARAGQGIGERAGGAVEREHARVGDRPCAEPLRMGEHRDGTRGDRDIGPELRVGALDA